MEIKGLLPIGSVVLLNGAEKKIVVTGIKQTDDEEHIEYDYVGVGYPEGFIGPNLQLLFNHDDIGKVFHKGYEDEEREEFLENLQEYFENK